MNIIYLGEYTLNRFYAAASSKRVINQISYLKKFETVHSITVSNHSSDDKSNINLKVSKKKGLLYLIILPIYWLIICLLLLCLKQRRQKNFIILETNINLTSVVPSLWGKIIGYKIIQDVVEDFTLVEGITLNAKLNFKLGYFIIDKYPSFIDGYLVISKRLKQKYLKYNKPLIVLYNSVQERILTASDLNTQFNFTYMGTYGYKDGVKELISAFRKLSKIEPSAKLNLIGKGSGKYFDECMNLIKDNLYIKYYGYLDEDVMLSICRNSDVACITRPDIPFAHYGFPFKVAEYLSLGKAVLCTPVSDIPDLFSNKINMFITDGFSIDAIYQMMEFCLENREIVNDVSISGYDFFNNNFSINIIGEKLRVFLSNIF